MKWKIAVAVLLSAVSFVAWYVPHNRADAWQPASAFAAPPAQDRLVAAGGVVEPASQARQLEATVVGRIITMKLEEGDSVSAGETIAEIENADLKAQLAEAEAALAARSNELLRLKTGARPQEREAARAALREADALANVARTNFDRQQALGKKQIVSKEAVDQALADRDAAAARQALLSQQLALLVAPPRDEDVAIAQANLTSAEAKLAEIKAQLEKTMVRSPIDGIVLKLYRRLGETVSNLPPTPIATIGDTRHLRVRADIDQADVGQVALGRTVWITADAFPDRRFRGKVARIGAQLGPKNFRNDHPEERIDTKVLEVLIDLDAGAPFPVGLPVDVRVEGASTPPALSRDGEPPNLRPGTTEFSRTVER